MSQNCDDYIDSCNKELDYLTQYFGLKQKFEDAIVQLSSNLINLERNSIPSQSSLEKIKDIQLEIAHNEADLQNAKMLTSNSKVFSRSVSVMSELHGYERKLRELFEHTNNLTENLCKEMMLNEKYSALSVKFADRLNGAREIVNKMEKDDIEKSLLNELTSISDNLHGLLTDMDSLIYSKMDRSSEIFLKYSEDQQSHSRSLQAIDSKIHSFQHQLKQQQENNEKITENKQKLLDLIKRISNQFNSLPVPNDLVLLQSNCVLLNSLLFNIKSTESQLDDLLRNSSLESTELSTNNKHRQSINQISRDIDELKTRIENKLRESKKTEMELKEHARAVYVARDFLKSCQSKMSIIVVNKANLYQLENDLSKIKDLQMSVERNESIISDVSKLDMANLRCLSDEGTVKIQNEINTLNTSFDDVKLSINATKCSIENAFTELKIQNAQEEEFIQWMKTEEKLLKLTDQYDDVQSIEAEMKRLESLIQQLSSKESFVKSLTMLCSDELQAKRHVQIKERFDELCKLIKNKEESLNKLLHDLKTFQAMCSQWKKWFSQKKSGGIQQMNDSNKKNLSVLKTMAENKDSKFEEVMTISLLGEALLPRVTVTGREKIKAEIKSVRDQCHEVFDNIISNVEKMEENIRSKETIQQELVKYRSHMNRIRNECEEEIRIIEPLQIQYGIGLEQKERQLHKFEELKLEVTSLNNSLQKLENSNNLSSKDDVITEINALCEDCFSLKTLTENAKNLSSISLRNHECFEEACILSEDNIAISKKKLLLCQDMDGNDVSIDSKMSRIQNMLLKEVIDNDSRDDKLFTQLETAFNKAVSTSSDSEQKIFKTKLENLFEERRSTQEKWKILKSTLETTYVDLEHFKIQYNKISLLLDGIRKETHISGSNSDRMRKTIENCRQLLNESEELKDLAMHILEMSRNQLPLNMTKSLQNQLEESLKNLYQTENNVKFENELIDNFDEKEQAFISSVNSTDYSLDSMKDRWNESSNPESLGNIINSFDEIFIAKTEVESNLEEMQSIASYFSKISSEKSKPLKIKLNSAKKTFESLCHEISTTKVKFDNSYKFIKDIMGKLNNEKNELEMLSDLSNQQVPDQKLLKINLIADFNKNKEAISTISERINGINIQPINHQYIYSFLNGEKVRLIKTCQNLNSDLEQNLNILTKSFKDQENLEKEILSISESFLCLESLKHNLQNDMDNFEDKLIEIERMLTLIGSLRRNCDVLLATKSPGCSFELELIRNKRKDLEKYEGDYKSLKNMINLKRKEFITIEDEISKLSRQQEMLDEQIENLSNFGTALNNKKVMLEKSKNVKEQIVTIQQDVDEINDKILDCLNQNHFVKLVEKIHEKCLEQIERVERHIGNHEKSCLLNNKFDNFHKELMGKISELKSQLQKCEVMEDIENLPNFDEVHATIKEFILLSDECKEFSSPEGKQIIANKVGNVEKSVKNLETSSNKIKWKWEKDQFKMSEYQAQTGQLKNRLETIKTTLDSLKSICPDDLSGKRKKYQDVKSLQQELLEWKSEMNEHFEQMKLSKSDDCQHSELSKDYRKILADVNFHVTEFKNLMNYYLNFEQKLDEFRQWLDGKDNQISGLTVSLDLTPEQVKTEIKEIHLINHQIKEGQLIISSIKESFSLVGSSTSKNGQKILSERIHLHQERLDNIKGLLNEKLSELETKRDQIEKLESFMEDFQKWLGEQEGKALPAQLLANLNEKQIHLEKIQSLQLKICDKRVDSDRLSEFWKECPTSLNVLHQIKGLKSRYNSVSSAVQHQIDIAARWVANHQSFQNQKDVFSENLRAISDSSKQIRNLLKNSQDIDCLMKDVEIIEDEIVKLEDSRLNFEASYNLVVGETNDAGKEGLVRNYLEQINEYNKTVENFEKLKSDLKRIVGIENQVSMNLRNLRNWYEKFQMIVTSQLSDSALVPHVLNNNISLVDSWICEFTEKKHGLNEIESFQNEIKKEAIKNSLKELQNNFQSLENSLKEKKSYVSELLDLLMNYLMAQDEAHQWLDGVRLKLDHNNDLRGSEFVISQRLENVKDVSRIISTGKTIMDNVIEVANCLMKRVSDKKQQEKLLNEVDETENGFISLTNKTVDLESKLFDVFSKWKKYVKDLQQIETFIETCGKRKQKTLDLESTYHGNTENLIEQLLTLLDEIYDHKQKLILFIESAKALKEISQEIHLDMVSNDLTDQLISHEMDCKYHADRLRQAKNDLTAFLDAHHEMKEWLNTVNVNVWKFDQLHGVPTLEEYQRLIDEFQSLESKTPEGDRLLDRCAQMSNKLMSINDEGKSALESTNLIQKSWVNMKEKMGELRKRMNQLSDIWLTFEHLYSEVEDWINASNECTNRICQEGYLNEDTNNKYLTNLKALRFDIDFIREKISRILDLYYKAETFSAFSKSKNPLNLQKLFCDTLEKIGATESLLITTQNQIEKFHKNCHDDEKWLIEVSLSMSNVFKESENLNSVEDVKHQFQYCNEVKQKVDLFSTEKIQDLSKLAEVINQQIRKPTPLKTDINMKIVSLNQDVKNLLNLTDKTKNAIKLRSNKIKTFRDILERVENFIYRELPEWWASNERTITVDPEDCKTQVDSIQTIIANVSSLQSEFEQVWLDQVHKRNYRPKDPNLSQSVDDDIFSIESNQYPKDRMFNSNIHLDQIKSDLAESRSRLDQKYNDTLKHRQIWIKIDEHLEDLEVSISRKAIEVEMMLSKSKDDEALYVEFENALVDLIAKRKILDEIENDINHVNGNSNSRYYVNARQYPRYVNICQQYAEILDNVELVRRNLRSMNANAMLGKLLKNRDSDDFSQNVVRNELLSKYPQAGTQTNRNAFTTMRNLKKFSSNPSLNDTSMSLSKSDSPTNDIRKSIDAAVLTDIQKHQTFAHTSMDNHISKKAKKLSEHSNEVMKNHRKSFDKTDGSNHNRISDKNKKKEERYHKLRELLLMIKDIRESANLDSYQFPPSVPRNAMSPNSNFRSSTESVRRNMSPTKSPKKKITKSPSKSKEYLGQRPVPMGCASPNGKFSDSPRKSLSSPKKSVRSNSRHRVTGI